MLIVPLAALVMGMLNAKYVFGPSAMASSYFVWLDTGVQSVTD
jgi:hypothetical protein